MRVNSITNNTNFSGKICVIGKKDLTIANPNKILENALEQSNAACKAITNYCEKNNIPYHIDAFPRESPILAKYRSDMNSAPITVEEIPEDIIECPVLTDKDVKPFVDKCEASFEEALDIFDCPPTEKQEILAEAPDCVFAEISIPKENMFVASEILKKLPLGQFDVVNGVMIT